MPTGSTRSICSAVAAAWLATAAGAQGTAGEEAGPGGDQAQAVALMLDFAGRTGLSSDAVPQRYLWTDAFALHSFLDLYAETGDPAYGALASDLIHQVHGVLGRHRPDDARSGWISGLPQEEGARHPTVAGLRIGKPLPEREPGEPLDERLEWDRDGQYFHYLTRWMDALTSAAAILDEPLYDQLADELAAGVLPSFLVRSSDGVAVGLAWKMSIDLSRPQVAGMNPHDTLDGYVTFRRLNSDSQAAGTLDLGEEISILRELSGHGRWETGDPLGIGVLLMNAFQLVILPDRTPAEDQLVGDLLADAAAGLQEYLGHEPLSVPASQRLAFRELGLAIGLSTLPAIAAQAERSPDLAASVQPHLSFLMERGPLGSQLVAFWSDPEHHDVPTWRDHRDINEVMLATALTDAYTGTAGVSGPDHRQ